MYQSSSVTFIRVSNLEQQWTSLNWAWVVTCDIIACILDQSQLVGDEQISVQNFQVYLL